jgi:beta-glucosidase
MAESGDVFWSHYIDENDSFVSFWFGLSYSKFEYSNLELSQKSFANNESIEVSVTLKNTGKYSGKKWFSYTS